MPAARVPDFLPSKHGFPFGNSFPDGTPVLTIPTPFGTLPIGNAAGGLCGGMIFAIRDLFALHQAPPLAPEPPVVTYLCQRLLDSFQLPFGVLKYYDWQRRPSHSRFVAGVLIQDGLSRLTIEEEWPKIRASLDTQQLTPLGLVKAHSFSPLDMGKNHQVLAYGYELNDETGDLVVHVYDPNYPGDDNVRVSWNLLDPERGRVIVHSIEGESIRGVFLTDYHPPTSEPMFP